MPRLCPRKGKANECPEKQYANTMKILYFSDVHGKFQALPSLPKADMVIIGGDFTQFGSNKDFLEAIRTVEETFPEFYAVAGNLDPADSNNILRDTGHLLSTGDNFVHGLHILGISGSHTCPRPTPFEWKDDDMENLLALVPGFPIDILVTHAPPFGSGADVIPNGMHVGSRAIASFARNRRPRLHLCGHIHEAAGIFDGEGIPLVNCGDFATTGNYAVIEWDVALAPQITLFQK